MTEEEIKRTQKHIGTKDDGFWGPESIAACKEHLLKLMPTPHPFPLEGSTAFGKLYGKHGVKNGYEPTGKKFKLPFTIYYEGSEVDELSPHEECSASLKRVFDRLATVYPKTASRMAAGILIYNGLYNPRKKTENSTSWSMHAWKVAIDLNAPANGYKMSWPIESTMPIEVMECFAHEGWLAAGAFWGYDAMHFQATQPI